MRRITRYALVGLAATSLLSFTPPDHKKPKKKYIDKANMDLSVKPGDNFYQYANGTWLKNNPVPASKTRWGSFNQLAEQSSQQMNTILLDASKHTSDPQMQKLGDFYLSGIDTVALDRLGYQPIKADLDRISNLTSITELLSELAYERTQGVGSALFGFFVGQDRKNVDLYIPQLSQGGTTLPDRDYYIKNDSRSVTIRNAYQQHLTKMFTLIGENEATAKAHADAVIRIETALAKAQMPRVEMRDPYKTYNKFAVKDLSTTTPGVDWGWMFGKLHLKGADSVIVNNSFLL